MDRSTRTLALTLTLLVVAVLVPLLALRGCPGRQHGRPSDTTAGQAPAIPDQIVPHARSAAGTSDTPAPPEPEPHREPGVARRVTLRDSWDGSIVPGIAVRFEAEGAAAIEIESDVAGVIHLPAGLAARTVVLPRPWRMLGNAAVSVDEVDEVWLTRSLSALVTVRSEFGSTIDSSSVRLFAAPGGRLAAGPGRRVTPPPGNADWLRARGVRTARLEGSVVAPGTWRVEVPRVKGMCLVGFAPGWRPALEPLPDVPADREVAVTLVLKPTQWVTGHIRSSDGTPVAGAKVVLYSTWKGRFDDLSEEYLNAIGVDRGAFGGVWDKGRDSSRRVFMSSCETSADGSFRADVRSDGRVLVVGYAQDHARASLELGSFVGDCADVELVALRRGAADAVFIECAGARMTNAQFVLADMDYEDEQPAFDVASDSDGCIRSTWLVRGRRYALIPTGRKVPEGHRRPHFLTYEGQSVLDLATLPTRRP